MTYRLVAVVCEGQTEEAFVRRVLQPAASAQDVYLEPIIVKTSRPAARTALRGGGSWKGYAEELRRVLHGTHFAMVTTLIDLYAYPRDAPGAQMGDTDPYRKAARREAAIAEGFDDDPRLLPHLLVHEMETLVIAAAVSIGHVLGDPSAANRLAVVVGEHGDDPHRIDDGPLTAPSKRLLAVAPGYLKVTDGIDIVLEAGLAAVVASCPRFADWWQRVLGRQVGSHPPTR